MWFTALDTAAKCPVGFSVKAKGRGRALTSQSVPKARPRSIYGLEHSSLTIFIDKRGYIACWRGSLSFKFGINRWQA